jgi:hypothetical protein
MNIEKNYFLSLSFQNGIVKTAIKKSLSISQEETLLL